MIAQLTSCHVIKLPWGTVENWRQLCVLMSHTEWDKAAAGVHPSTAPSPPKRALCRLERLPSQNNPKRSVCREGPAQGDQIYFPLLDTVPCPRPTCSQVSSGECQGVNTAGQELPTAAAAGLVLFSCAKSLVTCNESQTCPLNSS